MPRQARKESGTGVYYVMLRGINRPDIFEDAEDYMRKIRGRFFDPEEIEKNKNIENPF